ncbi:MAG: NADH-quinone oxidoreductase subunit B [Thermoplasmata archaeon]
MTEGGPIVWGWKSSDFLEWISGALTKVAEKTRVKKVVNVLTERLFNWGRRNSPWPLHWGIMCCSIEMAAASGPRFDAERFGIIYRSTPRQVDILLINGPISQKLVPSIKKLYDQMPAPKWVVAMGECAISGGPFWDSYNIVQGVDKIVPVDIYIPGCPVRPEGMIDGFLKLKELVEKDRKDVFLQPKRRSDIRLKEVV